jgi:hypothetical protein
MGLSEACRDSIQVFGGDLGGFSGQIPGDACGQAADGFAEGGGVGAVRDSGVAERQRVGLELGLSVFQGLGG